MYSTAYKSSINSAIFLLVLVLFHLSIFLILSYFCLILLQLLCCVTPFLLLLCFTLQFSHNLSIFVDNVGFFWKIGFARLNELIGYILFWNWAFLRSDTFSIWKPTIMRGIKLILVWLWIKILGETCIETFLVVIFHDIQRKFDWAVRNIS